MSTVKTIKTTDELTKIRFPQAVKRIISIMSDKKAENVVLLKLKGINKITNYMVICTGFSSRQNLAISQEIQIKIKTELKKRVFSVEGESGAEWILLDFIDFIVHIFSPESRQKYQIEKLWMDATRYYLYTN